jgi:hypothetical protein
MGDKTSLSKVPCQSVPHVDKSVQRQVLWILKRQLRHPQGLNY